MAPTVQYVLRSSLIALLGALMSGCGTLRLPAVDPTGERIFLPDPSYTTFVSPYDSNPGLSCLPRPAFTEPPPIPPCTGTPGGPAGTGLARQPDQARLLLTPSKIIAPINSEVVLLAGVCGGDGFLVTKQPIEWMLSPDSVGNIHALGESAHPHIAKLVHHSPRKECNTLAITRTTTAAHMITRGTAQTNDDIWVAKGQTWISVSSPTEGVSYVTALADGGQNWDFRRQTATIHWVDMQWAFPSPQIARAGQPARLSTAVSRMSTGGPATGVFVRYDVVEGTEASFFGEGRTSLELQTNENGRAEVDVVQNQPGPGATKIRIRILSSDLRAAGTDRAVIGEGFTTVTWSAPGLTVAVAGPSTVARGSTASYRIDVANPGDVATRNVEVQAQIPPALKYLNSQPAAEIFGNAVVWRLGTLGPKQVVRIDVNFQTANAGEVPVAVRAVSPDATEAIARTPTRIVESALAVRFVDPPQTAAVGQVVGFNFEVINTGGTPLQSVVVKDIFDAGLQPNYQVDPNRPLTMDPFSLAPGETKSQSVSFVARRAGQLCHTLEVSASGGHVASDRACIEVTQPVLKVEVLKTGPEQARVGDRIPFTIVVTNTGDGVLTNVRVTDTPDQNLQPVEGSGDLPDQGSEKLQVVGDSIVWNVPTLGPNRTVRLQLVCIGKSEAVTATNSVQVTADGGVQHAASAQVAIQAAARPAPAPTPGAPRQPATPTTPPAASAQGEFKVQLVAVSNGIRMGETGTFFVFLQNFQNVPESEVIVTLQLPDGLEYVRHSWSSNLPLLSNPNNLRTIEIGPIRSIAAQQTTLQPIKVDLKGTKTGNYEVQVQVRSKNLVQPVQATTKTFVTAQ